MLEQVRAEYEALPESVKATLSFYEYQWLSGAEKSRLVQTMTEPDHYDD